MDTLSNKGHTLAYAVHHTCICFYFIYALRAGSLKRLCPDGPLLYMGQLPARFRRILDRHKQRTHRFGTHQLMGSLTTG